MAQMYRPGVRLYVDKTRSKIVPESSPEAAMLLCSATGEIPMDDAKRLGLLDPKPVKPHEAASEGTSAPSDAASPPDVEKEAEDVEAKAMPAPPEDKAVKGPEAMKVTDTRRMAGR